MARLPIALIFLLVLSLNSAPAQCRVLESGELSFSTPEQMGEDAKTAPCQNSERIDAALQLFRKMGAEESAISVEKFPGVENISVRKSGSLPEAIVVGAHYDKVSKGCGAIDNWSGIVALGHLYRTLKDAPLNKTLLFVAFGKEEEGLKGSRAMVRNISKEEAQQYCAMINLDSFGLGAPQAARNLSAPKLLQLAATLAKRMRMPFGDAAIPGDSDSSPFWDKKIPALTLHGLNNEFRTILHSPKDKPERVKSESVYLGYRLALAMLQSVDASPCDSWR